jgi:hypothetical protein
MDIVGCILRGRRQEWAVGFGPERDKSKINLASKGLLWKTQTFAKII